MGKLDSHLGETPAQEPVYSEGESPRVTDEFSAPVSGGAPEKVPPLTSGNLRIQLAEEERALKEAIEAEKEKQNALFRQSDSENLMLVALAREYVELGLKLERFRPLIQFFKHIFGGQVVRNLETSFIHRIKAQPNKPVLPIQSIEFPETVILENERIITRRLSELMAVDLVADNHERFFRRKLAEVLGEVEVLENVINLLRKIAQAAGFMITDENLFLVPQNQQVLLAIAERARTRGGKDETELFQPDHHAPPPISHPSENSPDPAIDFWGGCARLARRVRLTKLAAFFESKR